MHFPHFNLHPRTLYSVLIGYMQHYGDIVNDADQLRVALADSEEITDYAMHKVGTAIDGDQADLISRVGLQWLDYAKAHPDNPQGYAETAKQLLDESQSS